MGNNDKSSDVTNIIIIHWCMTVTISMKNKLIDVLRGEIVVRSFSLRTSEHVNMLNFL